MMNNASTNLNRMTSCYNVASDGFFEKIKTKLLYLHCRFKQHPMSLLLPKDASGITLFHYETYFDLLRNTMTPNSLKAFEYFEKVINQIKSFKLRQCLLFHLLIMHSELASLPLREDLFDSFKSNLEEIFSIVAAQTTYENYLKMFSAEGFDTYCMTEVLYVSIGAYLKLFITETSYRPLIGDITQLEADLTTLILIEQLLKFLNVVILSLNRLNDLVLCKEFLIKQVSFDQDLFRITTSKWFIDYYEIYIFVLCIIKKFSLYPSLKAFSHHLDINALSQFSKNLFCVMEANMLLCYQNFKKEFKLKLITNESFETLMMYSLYKNDLYVWIRFLREDYRVDCQFCYPSFHKFNSKFIMKKVIASLSIKLWTLIANINKANNEAKIDLGDINIALLKEYVQSLKGYLTCNLISSFTNDNVYDITNRNSWSLTYFDVFSLSECLLTFVYIVSKYNKALNGLLRISKDRLIMELFTHLINALCEKHSLIIPMKLYNYKQTIMKNAVIIIDYFINQSTESIAPVLSQIKALAIYDELIAGLEELSNSQSMLLFYFANRILKVLKSETHKNKLRIYGLSKYPFDYCDVTEENNTNALSPLPLQSLNPFSFNSALVDNKENMCILGNKSTFIIENPEMEIGLKASVEVQLQFKCQPQCYPQSQPKAQSQCHFAAFDIFQIKDNYDLEQLKNVFKDEIVLNKKEGRVYLMSTSNDPVILIQSPVINNNNSNEKKKETETMPHCNTILSHLQIDINGRENIINYIYNQMYQEEITNTEISNYINSTKYYDLNNGINYFDFTDRIDVLLS